ncbi:helix-turn-helix domain-containing protein [Herbiconiux sp. CPCC 203407]|uniref:Helix-turn-helix domain-containing protein n=1 Tax=Herbiconiux oxytropis TaxID=2970915 RepID=A0AA41XFQ9_9MICO|nr:helix-turn-helix domain-containing protein [Herbiconiux oxytropis]MCS5722055.1 helix-turn-helix domain-containing protein [Herbiconiux oxytropis]MCS5725638.1 helix-turn-helix domain-containing protein [Herbiconiux oxytropis]
MLSKVVLLAIPGVAPFEFGVVCEVFGIDRSEHGGPEFEFSIATAEPGPVRTSLGYDMLIADGLEKAAEADLIAVPAHVIDADVHPEVVRVLREAADRGAWIISICSGAFTLAKSGLLSARSATTHWMHAERLAADFPDVSVDPDVLFVEDGRIITSAGTASGIDACLHLIRIELGAAAANVVARRMVVPPQRAGGQSQYIAAPVKERCTDSFAEVTEWMLEHLEEELTIDELARRALMSPRTFARRFKADLGTTPGAWLNRQRLLRAQQLLEESSLGLDAVAAESGFGTAAVMRHHFAKTLDTTPAAYRRAFTVRLSA